MYKIIIQDFARDLAEMNTIYKFNLKFEITKNSRKPPKKNPKRKYIIPFATSDENYKEELKKQSEIEEQQAPEEKSEKEIYNDDIVPFTISDDVEKLSTASNYF
ncbi:unnamed protein product [Rhizophagus irregularis]|nr:unnamed protein product [Rhizophagus irregularis]CAB5390957.1 unnamed protein product [Rhizophagus irregularis]